MAKKKIKSIPITTLLFIAIPVFVVLVIFLNLATSKTEYVYAKVKISQGFWWAKAVKPDIWFTSALEGGAIEKNLLGKPIAEVLEVRYYNTDLGSINEEKYDIYLSLKLAADYNDRTQKYTYKRSILAIGSPIDLEIPGTQITGTVIDISEQEFDEEYVEKIVYITKKFAYPWEFDAIIIGDKYFDGTEFVFEVLDKYQTKTAAISSGYYGTTTSGTTDTISYIVVKAKVKAKLKNNKLFFGEERTIRSGNLLTVATDNYSFAGYIIGRVE